MQGPGADVPVLDVSDPGLVNEGSSAVFNLTLSHAVDAPTTLSFTFSGQADAGDIGTPVVTVGGTVVTLTIVVNNAFRPYAFDPERRSPFDALEWSDYQA
ncbi:hypothetical protein N0K08_22990, partial [Acidovorax sp. Be4]|nr:hypothetical protein [Acidovorax sp. Be4]